MKQILSADQIRDGVRQLAEKLTGVYGERPITIVAILTGSLVLLADLIRQLEMPLRVAMVQANRYRTPDEPREGLVITDALVPNLKDRDVLVIDDIFDTGHTLVEVLAQLLTHEPASLRSAVLDAEDRPLRGAHPAGLRDVRNSGRVCRRLRTGLRRSVPQLAVRGGAGAGRPGVGIDKEIRRGGDKERRPGIASPCLPSPLLLVFCFMRRILHIIDSLGHNGRAKQLLVLGARTVCNRVSTFTSRRSMVAGHLVGEFQAAGIADY